jgi:hypothetical protein
MAEGGKEFSCLKIIGKKVDRPSTATMTDREGTLKDRRKDLGGVCRRRGNRCEKISRLDFLLLL